MEQLNLDESMIILLLLESQILIKIYNNTHHPSELLIDIRILLEEMLLTLMLLQQINRI
jgi:hypothetical protein